MVFWSDERCSESDIFCARVSQNNRVIDTVGKIVCSEFRRQEQVKACFDGNKYFVAWHDSRNVSTGRNIYGALVDCDGTVLDSSEILITNQGNTGYLDICRGNRCYLVVWSTGSWSDIYGARIDTSGVLIDTNAIVISNAYRSQIFPKVAFDGVNFFVIWQDDRNYPTTCLYGARINEDGVVIDTNGIRITDVNSNESFPAIIYNGENYFVCFASILNSWHKDIYGARMTTDGVLIDTNWIAISLANRDQILPSIVFTGQEYFVVWSDFRNDPNNMTPEVYGARISIDGIVL